MLNEKIRPSEIKRDASLSHSFYSDIGEVLSDVLKILRKKGNNWQVTPEQFVGEFFNAVLLDGKIIMKSNYDDEVKIFNGIDEFTDKFSVMTPVAEIKQEFQNFTKSKYYKTAERLHDLMRYNTEKNVFEVPECYIEVIVKREKGNIMTSVYNKVLDKLSI